MTWLTTIIGAAAAGITSLPMPIPITDAPIDRVVTNLEARVRDNPDDAHARYALGRAHALAYATKLDTIRGYEYTEWFEPLPPNARDWRSDDRAQPGNPIEGPDLTKHLKAAVRNLTDAIRMRRAPYYYLALGSVLETAGDARLNLHPGMLTPGEPRWRAAEDAYVKGLPDEESVKVVRARVLWETLDPARRSSIDESTLTGLWNARGKATGERRAVIDEILSEFWSAQTADSYFIAFALALATEAKLDDRVGDAFSLRISVEAAECFLRVTDNDRGHQDDAVRRDIAKAAVAELSKQHPSGGITPIVFPLHNGSTLESLIDPHSAVSFNLDGTGLRQSWTWVRPVAGILVWDPTSSGRITSGRQLFGSVSWWVMFENGYQALDALDDNRDGVLTGSEINGIAVWIDRDGDAVSDEGEVTPARAFGITGIATQPTSVQDDSLANLTGLRLRDGRNLPTYDWIATPRPKTNPAALDTRLYRHTWSAAGESKSSEGKR